MVKKIFLTVLLAVVSIGVNAQDTVEKKSTRFGFKGGLNLSNFIGDELYNNYEGITKSRIGYHIGTVLDIAISEKFALQPEVIYSTQGANYETSEPIIVGSSYIEKIEENIKLDYVTIPFMAKFYALKGLSIEAGTHIAFLVSSKKDVKGTGLFGITSNKTMDIKKEVNSFDLGLNFGLGYELDMGVFFQGRYSFGIVDVFDDKDDYQRNSVFQFSVGYKLN